MNYCYFHSHFVIRFDFAKKVDSFHVLKEGVTVESGYTDLIICRNLLVLSAVICYFLMPNGTKMFSCCNKITSKTNADACVITKLIAHSKSVVFL